VSGNKRNNTAHKVKTGHLIQTQPYLFLFQSDHLLGSAELKSNQ